MALHLSGQNMSEESKYGTVLCECKEILRQG